MQMTFEDAVAHIRKKPSHCVPDGYSMISITNAHHTILTLLQIALIPSCLLQRTLVYCDRSVLHNVSFSKNCYWSTATFRPSDFLSNDYQEITWLKWDLLVQATRSGLHCLSMRTYSSFETRLMLYLAQGETCTISENYTIVIE
jgi:hypothetical protein